MKKKIAVEAVLTNAANEVEKALEVLRNAGKVISDRGASEVIAEVSVPEEGIYLVYKDGTFMPFTGKEKKEGVSGIGVVYDGHAFKVSLEGLGEQQLIKDEKNRCPEDSPFYKTECEGLHDWDFVSATNHLKECGMDMPLPDGWYIPTLAVLEVMCFLKEKINKALKYAGGEAMPNDYHWSSTEYSRSYARYVGFSNGSAYGNGKYYGYVVRPVTAFI